jgi:hypothetical protein
MKSIQMKLLLLTLAVLTCGIWFTSTYAQTGLPYSVQATLHFTDYDVIYLTDFINPKTQNFNSNVSGFSLDLVVNQQERILYKAQSQSGTIGLSVYVYVEVQVQLRGDPRPDWLVRGFTNNFTIDGRRTLTARDFAKGGSEISGTDIKENTPVKKRITDLAQATSTVPPGTYQIMMKVCNTDKQPIEGAADSKTIVIPYSALEGAFVEINDPKNGSITNNLAPTFSWTTGSPRVTVRVYEAGVNHRSPQDALTGSNPYLEKDLSGITTLTYPQDAKRQLQDNKAYVLQIEAKVSSNRGELGNFSRPVVFRITNDRIGTMMDNFLNTYSGDASATFATLRAEPNNWVAWSAFGNITLDGSTLTDTDLQALVNDLASRPELKLQLSIENQ